MFVPQKLLLIVLLAVGVWYAMRWLNRAPHKVMRRGAAPGGGPRARSQAAIEDLVACRVCGAYVVPGAGGCGKPTCPQPR